MQIPNDRKYSESHEWAKGQGEVEVGISDYAQQQLGDIVFVELPAVGDAVQKGDAFIVVESVKAVSSVYAPVSGTVIAVNDALESAPEMINEDAYGAWIVRLQAENDEELETLLDAAGYQAMVDAGQ